MCVGLHIGCKHIAQGRVLYELIFAKNEVLFLFKIKHISKSLFKRCADFVKFRIILNGAEIGFTVFFLNSENDESVIFICYLIGSFGNGEQSNVFAAVCFDSVKLLENVFFSVFVNYADNAGFAVVSTTRSNENPLLVVTEAGNYTPGEETENEGFNMYMDLLKMNHMKSK